MDTGGECVRYTCQRRLEYDSCGELFDRHIGHKSQQVTYRIDICCGFQPYHGCREAGETRLDDMT